MVLRAAVGRDPSMGGLTLEGQDLAGLDHNAELQNKLRGTFEEGFQQTQHADISALEHHAPVEVVPLVVAAPTALHTQIQGVNVPMGEGGGG